MEHNITMTAGSDIHHVGRTDNGYIYGMEFDEPLNSITDYVTRIKNKSGFSLHVPPQHLAWEENTANHLPVFIFDKENRPAATNSIDDIFSTY